MPLGWLLGLLAASWEALGASWQPLGGLLGPLRDLLVLLGASWRPLGNRLGPLGGLLAAFWCVLRPLGGLLEASWGGLWPILAPLERSLAGLGVVLGPLGRKSGPGYSGSTFRELPGRLLGGKTALAQAGVAFSGVLPRIHEGLWGGCERSKSGGVRPPPKAFS